VTGPPVLVSHRSPEVYAEDGGFVLVDPARLAALVPDAAGQDLLALFTTTALGDEVARTGVMVPVLGADPGYYDLHVQLDGDDAGVQRPADLVSDGWVLETGTGELFLDPLAALRAWDPDDPRHQRVRVPPGAYAVQLRGHLPEPGSATTADGSYSWVLRPTAALPWFTADVGPA
jgi:hypothetical protein